MCWVLSLVLWGQPLPGSWCVLGSSHEAMTRLAGVRPVLAEWVQDVAPNTAVLGHSLGHRGAVGTRHGGGLEKARAFTAPRLVLACRVTDMLCQAVPSHAEP